MHAAAPALLLPVQLTAFPRVKKRNGMQGVSFRYRSQRTAGDGAALRERSCNRGSAWQGLGTVPEQCGCVIYAAVGAAAWRFSLS